MKKRVLYTILLWLFADVYFFTAVKTLTANPIVHWAYWLADTLILVGVVFTIFGRKRGEAHRALSWLMSLLLLSAVPKLIGAPVLIIEDIVRLFRGFPPRSMWVSELALAVAAVPFLALLFGLTKGRHHYTIHKETLYFPDLPAAFDGFTLTQLSDIHAGSFTDAKGVNKGIDLVNAQQSDVILFTGDLVNNKATEMDPWISTFARLQAPYGKYSVLGNHDYGDYTHWDSEEVKAANLDDLKGVHKKIGFRLLLDEAVKIEKDGQSITLIGVENWGKGGFHKYGDLDKAILEIDDSQVKILLSHDPSHWEAKTLNHLKHIHLTLAGHTHGAQFGIELFNFKWSPIKYVYKQWAGLYKLKDRYLYVNRGFGFLGLKGRIGIWPEITVITLKKG
ncbi:metallophosphoesterase [Mucilaginibacter sp. UR6-11]|uniref:metallophosphoesterase n=1 Tax=Mucilaginibacter sp. UR6-11 TaxID=1435644 RepID=UPI001E5D3B48|nr:metallophosphoesterase [Mucilaginibacter sp. UR6-11]MCC8425552.1 metallophosphoesterase [Mucilaginibacter sp. UR6-11]